MPFSLGILTHEVKESFHNLIKSFGRSFTILFRKILDSIQVLRVEFSLQSAQTEPKSCDQLNMIWSSPFTWPFGSNSFEISLCKSIKCEICLS